MFISRVDFTFHSGHCLRIPSIFVRYHARFNNVTSGLSFLFPYLLEQGQSPPGGVGGGGGGPKKFFYVGGGGGGGGGGGTQQSFVRGGSAPRSNPLPFLI